MHPLEKKCVKDDFYYIFNGRKLVFDRALDLIGREERQVKGIQGEAEGHWRGGGAAGELGRGGFE